MGLTVAVNSMSVSHGGSSGKSIAFPDVCKTPVLGVPVPIPYPNIAMSSDVDQGSKQVKCDGESVILKSSEMSRSMGDEAGVQMGIISNKQMGKGKFENYSFDVKFEGKNVCRLLDPSTANRSSANGLHMAHLQAPVSTNDPNAKIIKGACDEVKKKQADEEVKKKENKQGSPAAGPGTSGIIQKHWDAMKTYLNKASPSFMIYFRNSGPDVGKWIEKVLHEPKPHEWTDGLSCKESRRKTGQAAAITDWIQEAYARTLKSGTPLRKELGVMKRDGMGQAVGTKFVFDVTSFDGVIISNRESYGKGRPILGRKKWKQLNFKNSWMTGDYDMMDIIKAGEVCTRPTPAEYGRLRFELNEAMGWPGIQHGPQSTWNTRQDKGFKGRFKEDGETKGDFSVATEIHLWLKTAALGAKFPGAKGAANKNSLANKSPNKRIVKAENPDDDRYLNLIDDNLTMLGPDGGLHLKEGKDYWDALVCCGCLDEGVEPDTEHLEESPEWKKKLAAAEHNETPWGDH